MSKVHSHLKLFLLPILLTCFQSRIMAQEPVMINFTVEDGLPSNEIHDLCIDDDGRLFIASNNGVAIYNGNRFERINQLNNFGDIVIIKIFKQGGKMWFISLSGRLYVFKSGKLTYYPFNDKILEIKRSNPYPITNFIIDSNNVVYLSFNGGGLVLIDSIGNVQIVKRQRNRNYKNQFIDQIDSSLLMFYTEHVDSHVPYKELTKTLVDMIEFEIEFKQERGKMTYDFFNYIKYGDSWIFTLGKFFYLIRNGKVIIEKDVNGPIVDCFIVDSTLYLGLHSNGLIIISLDDINTQRTILKDYTVTSIVQDSSYGIWIATVQSGLYYTPYKENIKLENKPSLLNNDILSITCKNDKLIYGSSKGMLYMNDLKSSQLSITLKELVEKEPIKGVICVDDFYLLNVSNGLIVLDTNEPYQINMGRDISNSIRGLFELESREILVVGRNVWGLSENFNMNPLVKNMTGISFFNCVDQDESGNYWLGTDHGLYQFRDNKLIHLKNGGGLLSSRISCIKVVGNNDVLIGTYGNGLVEYNIENKQVSQIKFDNNESFRFITGFCKGSNNDYWITSNSRLGRIKIQNQKLKYETLSFSVCDKSNKINSLSFCNKLLNLATDDGVLNIDTSALLHANNRPFLKLHSMNINGETFDVKKSLDLNYYENDVQFVYDGIDLRESENLIYYYRLVKDDSVAFIQTKSTSVDFLNLSPGKYRFEIAVMNRINKELSRKKRVTFTIAPPFWVTWWFITSEAAVAGLILSFVFIRRGKMLKAKSEREIEISKKLADLEMRALRSQMNPHFLFNSLNSIYSMINTGQNELAGKFLLSFSKLLRIVIEQSPKAKITLSNELRLLVIYIGLEKMRFDERFSYNIQIDKEIDPEMILIPSFILQPFVENAVIHGLRNKTKGEQKLEISIISSGKHLVYKIKDNGVGRKRALEEKRKKRIENKSVAISNSKQRIEMINMGGDGSTVSVEVVDLTDGDKKACGTEVVLRIKKEIVILKKKKS